MKKAISLLLAFSLVFCLFACNKEPISETISNSEKEVVESITELITTLVAPTTTAPSTVPETETAVRNYCYEDYSEALADCTADFGIRLFREVMSEQKNPLISPLSVVSALTMTGLGAEGKTLEQIENILKVAPEDLALYLRSFMNTAELSDGISLANSLWLNGTRFIPKNDFIGDCTEYLDAEVYSDPFNKLTLSKINNWISEKTDGEIKNALDEVPANAMAYLINTVLFEAEWLDKYMEYSVRENEIFTTEDGRKQTVSMLCSSESPHKVFALGKTKGIIRDYDNGYAFVAMLPDEGVSIKEAADSFTGKEFISKINGINNKDYSQTAYAGISCYVRLPKFNFDCSFELKDTLGRMGVTDAFCEKADFTKMGTSKDGYIYLSRVLHKTHIALTENGTKAGAATIAEMKAGSARIEEVIELYFDRPFIYAIVEKDSGMPVFFGAVTDFE